MVWNERAMLNVQCGSTWKIPASSAQWTKHFVDGSVLHNDATQAWVFYGTSTESRAYGHMPVPGSGQLLTSLCAEIGGFVSGMLALDAILSTTSIPVTGTGRTLCALVDNKALIRCIQKWHHQGQAGTLAPEYDLLQVAQGVIEKNARSQYTQSM